MKTDLGQRTLRKPLGQSAAPGTPEGFVPRASFLAATVVGRERPRGLGWFGAIFPNHKKARAKNSKRRPWSGLASASTLM
jgi:hypothetical protein